MRLYGGRKTNRQIERRFRAHMESRDAIVWDVDEPNRIARCKIQGTDELILCHYPQNWQTLPYYVKPGFAVRLIHRGGNKGFQEITGPGRAIPSPVAGAVMPPVGPVYDGVTSGMVPSAPGGGMYVSFTSGTYRINGMPYTFDTGAGGVVMGGSELMSSSSTMVMGFGTNDTLTFDAAPAAPNARYDLVVVGTDGLAHIVKGTASANPVMPSVPSDHIEICHVLILGGITVIEEKHINAMWETRVANTIEFTFSGTYWASTSGMYTQMYAEFHNANPYISGRATILCQYGWALSVDHTFTLQMDAGTGYLWKTGGVTGSSLTFTGTASYRDFRYYRQETLIPPGYTAIDETAENPAGTYTVLRGTASILGGIYFVHYIEQLFTEP